MKAECDRASYATGASSYVTESSMDERPKLMISPWVSGEPLHYECSPCGHRFVLSDEGDPSVNAKDLWAAFTEHVRNQHQSEVER